MPCGVMVARRILVPPVRVRILPRQQNFQADLFQPFFVTFRQHSPKIDLDHNKSMCNNQISSLIVCS